MLVLVSRIIPHTGRRTACGKARLWASGEEKRCHGECRTCLEVPRSSGACVLCTVPKASGVSQTDAATPKVTCTLHPYRLMRTSPFRHFRKGSQIGQTTTWEEVQSQAGSCSSRPITEVFTSRAHWVFSQERQNETCRSACHLSCPGVFYSITACAQTTSGWRGQEWT
jgi:hypothetical protein